MKLKKYEATSEREAIDLVRQDLGTEAFIVNMKKIQPRGIKSFFKKAKVEVTAAYDEKLFRLKKDEPEQIVEEKFEYNQDLELEDIPDMPIEEVFENTENTHNFEIEEEDINSDFRDIKIVEQEEKIKELEEKLESTEQILNKVVSELKLGSKVLNNSKRKYGNPMIQVFYETLISQGVTEEISHEILSEINNVDNTCELDINLIVKVVYNSIIKHLTVSKQKLESEKNKPKIMTFIGPTGVGKTTTIAKLSSNFILNDDVNVGLLTSDTYRIAAIEQLKTYAEILNIEVRVVYDNLEIIDNIIFMGRENDIIMIDTAGRSHKDQDTLSELKELLEYVGDSEKYLVLSLTTKFEDLVNIINTYKQITDFDIIFTKLDETAGIGNILNICYTTGKSVSYLTDGQSVPDDIEEMDPEKITKLLLGLGGD